jgi:ssDNA-binding Zn-finger/Zn-ribbon topoisomerase 1
MHCEKGVFTKVQIRRIEVPKCEFCGFVGTLEVYDSIRTIPMPFSKDAEIRIKNAECPECGEVDFEDIDFDRDMNAALRQEMREIIESFEQEGRHLESMERSLEIPKGTLSNWKRGREFSSVFSVLMRIIRAHPDLLYESSRRFRKKEE